ncbi:MAG: Gfo/Idh/MocA family oxidoreductase, partial [Clostridia bacterium]|nr:Gfo/Idh/MocA family oxidoreductase [Clostridia bacterium]
MKKLNVAIIGQGRSGRDIHGKYFLTEAGRERYNVVAISDKIEARRARAKEEYENCDVYEDYRELLARKDIDLVVNSTFSYLHYPVTMDALRHGKNVVSEKPFSKFAI